MAGIFNYTFWIVFSTMVLVRFIATQSTIMLIYHVNSYDRVKFENLIHKFCIKLLLYTSSLVNVSVTIMLIASFIITYNFIVPINENSSFYLDILFVFKNSLILLQSFVTIMSINSFVIVLLEVLKDNKNYSK